MAWLECCIIPALWIYTLTACRCTCRGCRQEKGIDEGPYCMSIFMNEMTSMIDETSILDVIIEFRGQGNVDDLVWPAFATNLGRGGVHATWSEGTGLGVLVKSRLGKIEASLGLQGLRNKIILWIRDAGSCWTQLMSGWYEDCRSEEHTSELQSPA